MLGGKMMKIVSKILMLVLLVFSFSLSIADMAYAVAQISLQNNSNLWLNLYIDGNFGCGPVMPRGFCTSSVKEGVHRLEARKGQKTVAHEEGVQIGDGTSPTWTPTIEDSAQDKTLLMVGKWRNEKGDVYSLTVTADKININCVIPGYSGPITGTIAENGTSIVLQYDWPNYQLRLNGNQCSGVSFLGKERVEFKLVKE
jgi:hypothetical protein